MAGRSTSKHLQSSPSSGTKAAISLFRAIDAKMQRPADIAPTSTTAHLAGGGARLAIRKLLLIGP